MTPPVDTPVTSASWVTFPTHWPGQVDLLTWCQTMTPGTAALLVLAGVIYLLFGYYLFKWLIVLNAALIGFALGGSVGSHFGAPIASGVLGAVIAAAICWPLMKYAVAVIGGMVGGVIGASLWRSFGLEPQFAWAGAMTGVVGFAMLAFILFRGSIIMYMSLQGALMLVVGILGLVYKYREIGPQLTHGLTANAFIMPMTVLIPALIGLIYQQHNHPAEAEGKK